MKRIVLLIVCVCGLLCATEERCPCQVKPPHRDEVQTIVHEQAPTVVDEDKCPCSVRPPHKDDVEESKCPCSVKPPHRTEAIEDKCPCSKPPHKDTTGAELFVQGTQGIMLCVQGGALAQKAGDIKVGLPYIFQGLSLLTDITSRSPKPEKAYQELYRFMNSLDKHELEQLARTVKLDNDIPIK